MLKTKVFNSGNSQAVRIPKEYRFDDEDVIINKIGSVVMIFQPKDRFAVHKEALYGFTDDFLADGRPSQGITQKRETM